MFLLLLLISRISHKAYLGRALECNTRSGHMCRRNKKEIYTDFPQLKNTIYNAVFQYMFKEGRQKTGVFVVELLMFSFNSLFSDKYRIRNVIRLCILYFYTDFTVACLSSKININICKNLNISLQSSVNELCSTLSSSRASAILLSYSKKHLFL